MYHRMIIINFLSNLFIISHFFSFFFIIFSCVTNFGNFLAIFDPPRPLGYPNFSAMDLNLSQQPLRHQPAWKKLVHDNFFCVNRAKILIWSFSLFWGLLGPLKGADLLVGASWRAAHGHRMIIINFLSNLFIISHFFSFFFIIFSCVTNFGNFLAIFDPPRPLGYPNFSAMDLNLSQQPLRHQPAWKKLVHDNFFCVNRAKILIWSFSLFWGLLGPLKGADLLVGASWRAAHGP